MSNAEMKPARYLRWHTKRQLVRKIQTHLGAGGTVYVSTYMRAVKYGPKHVESFKANRSGAYVRRGSRGIASTIVG